MDAIFRMCCWRDFPSRPHRRAELPSLDDESQEARVDELSDGPLPPDGGMIAIVMSKRAIF
jgi:hypothetical protein